MVICLVEEDGLDNDKVMPVDLSVFKSLLFLLFFLLLFLLFLEFDPFGSLLGAAEKVESISDVVFEHLQSGCVRLAAINSRGLK